MPEIANPVYGSGKSSGPLGFLRDAWHQAQDPYNFAGTPDGEMPGVYPPPPGAGPAPQLPPGYKSLTDPASDGPPPAQPATTRLRSRARFGGTVRVMTDPVTMVQDGDVVEFRFNV